MNVVSIAIIAAAGIINASGSAVLKYAMNYKAGPDPNMLRYGILVLAAMMLYGGCFPLYAMGLSRARLSTAQPTFSAVSYLSTTLIALLFFSEPFLPLKIGGLAVIIVGMVMVVG